VQIHSADEDITGRPSYIARVQSSNLLSHILASLEQAARQQSVAGALTKPSDRLLILVGHDTNLANISGALNLSWMVDGRRDDTPPGGALVFELWKGAGATGFSVRTYFMAQTLDQMRNAPPLSLANPPEREILWVPGCSRGDLSCDFGEFQKVVESGIVPAFVK
jgi:4-phytase/acid phosphatase